MNVYASENRVQAKKIYRGISMDRYQILANPDNLSTEQLVKICDPFPNFGYVRNGDVITIYTD